MLGKFKAAFAKRVHDASIEEDSDEQQVALAAAMLLLEVAWVDHEIEHRELDAIRTSLNQLYAIPASQADAVIEEARIEHERSVGVHEFTRSLNEQLSIEERRQLVVCLWRLNEFDGSSFHQEENAIRKISNLLYLNHSEFIAAKLAAKST